MTAAWVVSWIAAGFILGAVYVMVVSSIFDGIAERRGHRRVLEHEARMTRYAAERSTHT